MTRFAVMAAAIVAALTPAAARADVVTDWNVTTHQVLQAAQVAGGASSRTLAMVHVAMSDAVNSVQNRYTRHAAAMPINSGASAEAAAASAARQILIGLYPNQKTMIEEAYAASIKAIPEGSAKTQGVTLGEQVAAAV